MLTCPDALMEPVKVVRDGDRLTFVVVTQPGWPQDHVGEPRPVTWPRGFSARLLDGRGQLVAPDGSVVAGEGELLYGGIGGSGPLPGSFHVCTVGSTSYGPAS